LLVQIDTEVVERDKQIDKLSFIDMKGDFVKGKKIISSNDTK